MPDKSRFGYDRNQQAFTLEEFGHQLDIVIAAVATAQVTGEEPLGEPGKVNAGLPVGGSACRCAK